MSNKDIIRNQLKALITSENEGDSKRAEEILSDKFIAITRSSGIEETKSDLLKAIEKAKIDLEKKREVNKDYKKERKLDENIEVFEDKTIALTRSLITLKETGEKDTLYRNTHLFENHNGKWKCKVWQVTKLEKNFYQIVDLKEDSSSQYRYIK
jgi:hypothetical protein